MKDTKDFIQVFNQYRREKFFIPLVTQRSYAWDKERADLFLNLIYEHALNNTDYYITAIAVRKIGETLVKIGDGGNRVVTYIIMASALVNFIHDHYDALVEKYGEDSLSECESLIDYINKTILWENIKKGSARIELEDENDMKHLMYCLKNDDRIYKVKKSKIIENYKIALSFFEETFIDSEKNEISLEDFIEKGFFKVTTLVEECLTEEEETELYFLKNANIGIQLNNVEILGNSFHGYMRKYTEGEDKIKELQKRNRECFIKIQQIFGQKKGVFPEKYKQSFFTMYSYYLGIRSGKKSLIPFKDVSRILDKHITNVLTGKIKSNIFSNTETLIESLEFFVNFSVKMAEKSFSDFKYSDMLIDMPLNSMYWVLTIDLLSNKFKSKNLSDEDKKMFFKYGKKIFILHTFKAAGAHPETLFCNLVESCIINSENNKTSLSEEIIKAFERIQLQVLDNDTSHERIKRFIQDEGIYKKGNISKLIFDEINEELDTESRLRPFSLKNQDLTIEHICPQSLNENHQNLHKLGNLCLLSKKTNSQFSNTANWNEKYEKYFDTSWAINRTIKKYENNFSLDNEAIERNSILSDAFARAMRINKPALTLKPTYV